MDAKTAKAIEDRLKALLQTYANVETNGRLKADTEAKVHVFFQALQNNQVSETIGQLVLQMLAAIEQGDFQGASRNQQTISSKHWNQAKGYVTAFKVLVQFKQRYAQ